MNVAPCGANYPTVFSAIYLMKRLNTSPDRLVRDNRLPSKAYNEEDLSPCRW